jgi:isoleucyl-tRNA synthetase
MSDLAKREEEVLKFWKDEGIFEKSLHKPSPKGEYVFYDGPPFATGLPHTGSLLSSVIKDVVPRYKTMQGYRVPRRWGWDCHGLPIESLVEKELGLKTKKDILEIGIDTFNEKARSMVLQYVHEWERYVDRVGRWVDFKNSYKTMDNSYIESVWWALKELDNKKLLYEGRKVLMYCPHCETPLAKAEIAMDNTYKDVTDEALTVKFKIKNPKKHDLPENSYFLAWTTTPWTLPGNAALAVGKKVEYGIVESGGEHHISATASGSIFGADLVGVEYEPLFEVSGLRSPQSYKVYAGDFVSTEEGTGIVHVAPMYGEDDFALGQRERLPMVQLLTASGSYNEQAPELVRGLYYKKGGKLITEDLEKRGLVFEKEPHTHSYPHCYRCGTALIYNAVASWFINIQKVKSKMLAENEKVNWFPAHLKHGRFKHIVENAPDWTISRNRFWASPLPIWKEKKGSNLLVVGSLNDLLSKTKRSGNRYFVMRHGLAQNNIEGVIDSGDKEPYHLVEKGRNQAKHAAIELKNKNIDLIITSPLPRTRETAAILQKELGLPDTAVMVDERLTEVQAGVFSGRPVAEYRAALPVKDRFSQAPEGGETYTNIRHRVGEFLFEIEKRYVSKNILIVGHVRSVWFLKAISARRSLAQMMTEESLEEPVPNGLPEELHFVPFSHNANYELDLHRPYIDEVTLIDGQGRHYQRIPEVIDCWVESGAMPFASAQYPRDKSTVNPRRWFGLAPKGYPADFIAEYIAQTRTWFYYMHAMGVLLFGGRAFKNVVSTGTILAADGSKMSKSKGNYTDPYELMERYGADALRLTLMGSVVMQGEDLNFRDDDVKEAHNRVLGILQNSYKFFELYKDSLDTSVVAQKSPHVLDRWIFSRLGELVRDMTIAFDAYDMPQAVRPLREFVEDYSTWYLRRSRDRVKGERTDDGQYALATQREVLLSLSQLMAPLAPFIAESLYQDLGGKEKSVHLSNWPSQLPIDASLVENMKIARKAASLGLQLREKAGIKIRQPLARLSLKQLLPQELQTIVIDEVNVKEIVIDLALPEEAELTTELTEELREEGMLREWVRTIQAWRKEQKFSVSDRPGILIIGPDAPFIRKHREVLREATGLLSLEAKEGETVEFKRL